MSLPRLQYWVSILVVAHTFGAVCLSQQTPVKSLDEGNQFFYWTYGDVYGQNPWNYTYLDRVLGDTTIDGKLFHRMSAGSIEYSDSTQLRIPYAGSEQILCDFRWSLGDTVLLDTLGNVSWVVTQKGTGNIFSETQPFMTLASGVIRYRKVFKKFGVVKDSTNNGFAYSSLTLEAAKIGNTTYGSFPTAVSLHKLIPTRQSVVVFPNPSSGAISVQVQRHAPTDFRLEVFNLLGQRIGSASVGLLSPGNNIINWNQFNRNVGTPASGVYFVRLRLETETILRRVLIVR
jgi:hypothetical protein